MSALPERPEYDDRDGHDQFGLVMPFVCCASNGGDFDDVAFVAGFQVGRIDHALDAGTLAAMSDLVYAPLEKQLDLVAMRHGYRMDVLARFDHWVHVGFTRLDDRDDVGKAS